MTQGVMYVFLRLFIVPNLECGLHFCTAVCFRHHYNNLRYLNHLMMTRGIETHGGVARILLTTN